MTPPSSTPCREGNEAERLDDLVERCERALRGFPADGKIDNVTDTYTLSDLLLAGFIERREIEKPCPCCGTPKLDYSYFRITSGGKLFLAARGATA